MADGRAMGDEHEGLMAIEVVRLPSTGRVRAFFRPTCGCGWQGPRTRDGDEAGRELFGHTGDPQWIGDEGEEEKKLVP